MPGRGRNPRRVYDATGREVPPATIASMRQSGARSISLWCGGCGHHAPMTVDHLPDHVPVPDIPILYPVVCSSCGAKGERIRVTMDMDEHYRLCDEARARRFAAPGPAAKSES